jgi:hypothetical protein
VNHLRWAFKPENFDSMDDHDKLQNVMHRLHLINDWNQHKFWRRRFALEQQFKEEYSDEVNTTMAVAFRFLKEELDIGYAEEAIKNPELPAVYKKYTIMMKEFIDQDIDDALLGDEEDEH